MLETNYFCVDNRNMSEIILQMNEVLKNSVV